jgi:hypothetical protein
MKAILGKKVGMTQIFAEDGSVVPVTVVQAGPCVVIQKKSVETDGYDAVQVGFGEVKERRVNKPTAGRFKKINVKPTKYLREFRLESDLEPGSEIKADVFEAGEKVDVSDIERQRVPGRYRTLGPAQGAYDTRFQVSQEARINGRLRIARKGDEGQKAAGARRR